MPRNQDVNSLRIGATIIGLRARRRATISSWMHRHFEQVEVRLLGRSWEVQSECVAVFFCRVATVKQSANCRVARRPGRSNGHCTNYHLLTANKQQTPDLPEAPNNTQGRHDATATPATHKCDGGGKAGRCMSTRGSHSAKCTQGSELTLDPLEGQPVSQELSAAIFFCDG